MDVCSCVITSEMGTMFSPVRGNNGGQHFYTLHLAVMSQMSVFQVMVRPPGHWGKTEPQTQWFLICQSYLRHNTSCLLRVKPCSLEVGQLTTWMHLFQDQLHCPLEGSWNFALNLLYLSCIGLTFLLVKGRLIDWCSEVIRGTPFNNHYIQWRGDFSWSCYFNPVNIIQATKTSRE